jgi:hypothetical protein
VTGYDADAYEKQVLADMQKHPGDRYYERKWMDIIKAKRNKKDDADWRDNLTKNTLEAVGNDLKDRTVKAFTTPSGLLGLAAFAAGYGGLSTVGNVLSAGEKVAKLSGNGSRRRY